MEEVCEEKEVQIAQYAENRFSEVSILSKTDLSCSYTKEEYKQKLDKLQRKAERLHGELYQGGDPRRPIRWSTKPGRSYWKVGTRTKRR